MDKDNGILHKWSSRASSAREALHQDTMQLSVMVAAVGSTIHAVKVNK